MIRPLIAGLIMTIAIAVAIGAIVMAALIVVYLFGSIIIAL